jgi:uncharacterized membrane protein
MFNLFRKPKPLLNEEESRLIVKAIRHAEQRTSGEVRVFVESRCKYMDAMDRATEIFFSLKMDKTEFRNATLVYVALKDHQFALFGDEGIHQKVGSEYWTKRAAELIESFNKEDYAQGISATVIQIGEALQKHFPFVRETDKNELPDHIVFGN